MQENYVQEIVERLKLEPHVCPYQGRANRDSAEPASYKKCIETTYGSNTELSDLFPDVSESAARKLLQDGYKLLAAGVKEGDVKAARQLSEIAITLVKFVHTEMKHVPWASFLETLVQSLALLPEQNAEYVRERFNLFVALGDFYWRRHPLEQDIAAVAYYSAAEKLSAEKDTELDNNFIRVTLAEIDFVTSSGKDMVAELLAGPANSGCVEAMTFLGFVKSFNGDADERRWGRDLLWKAVEHNGPKAMCIVGERLLMGDAGFDCNPACGIKLFEQALAAGYLIAAEHLARAFEHGIGIPQDLDFARYYRSLALKMKDSRDEIPLLVGGEIMRETEEEYAEDVRRYAWS